MSESLDGIKLDISTGLSPRFQMGGSWEYSNKKPSNFSLMTTVCSPMDPTNPAGMENMSMISAKSDSTGKIELHSQLSLKSYIEGLSVKGEGFFPTADVENS
jgi:hypothetical protein